MSISTHAPAKLNVSLVVFDKRPDGFHDLHSVMAAIDLCDDLTVRLSEQKGIKLNCSGLPCPVTGDNLVCRAAELLAESFDLEPALEIDLYKRIPPGGGLGGASSDAAACLYCLNRLWDLDLSISELSNLAAKIGSDVPFFLHTPVALCTGRGETVKPLHQQLTLPILLILPDIHISTAQVYQNYVYDKDATDKQMQLVYYYLRHGDLDGLLTQGINSLTPTTMSISASLEKLRRQIEDRKIGPVFMSGSGSTLFVTSASQEQIALWAAQIQRDHLAKTFVVNFFPLHDSFPGGTPWR